jgi:uncharacterized membrane protein YphA (DoxX/SURF4 family)
MTPIRTAARAMLGAIFIGSGLQALRHSERLTGQAKPVADRLTPALQAANLPTDPETLVKVNGAVQVAGGLMLATGHFTRPAAAMLAGSLVPTTFAAHPFWTEPDAGRKAEQQVQFAKNLGLLGGLLLAAVDTGGRPSLRWRAKYAAKRTGASARRVGGAARRAERSLMRSARTAERSMVRSARTAKREAKLAVRATNLGRRLPG